MTEARGMLQFSCGPVISAPRKIARPPLPIARFGPICPMKSKKAVVPPAVPNRVSASPAVPSPTFTQGQIAACARRVWEARGRPSGQDFEIWLETERRLKEWHKSDPDRGGAMANPEITFNSDNEPKGAIEDWLSHFGGSTSRSETSL